MFTLKRSLTTPHPFAIIHQQAIRIGLICFPEVQDISIGISQTKGIRLFSNFYCNFTTKGFHSKYIQVGIRLHFDSDPLEKMFVLGSLGKIGGLRVAEAGQD